LKKNFKNIELKAKAAALSFLTGSHYADIRDVVYEIDSFRQYQPGDRRLDTRSSLKNRFTMSKSFDPDRDFTINLLIDCSASQYPCKEIVALTSLFVAFLADAVGDRFLYQSWGFSGRGEDTSSLVSFIEKMYEEGPVGIFDVINVKKDVNKIPTSNTMTFFISDFCWQGDRSFLKRFSSSFSSLVSVFTLATPPPFVGEFIDSETGKKVGVKNIKNFYDNLKLEVQSSVGNFRLAVLTNEDLSPLINVLRR
jgi:hypothetical protein